MSLEVCNFIACYADRGRHPNGAVVSITEANLKANIWKELAILQDKSDFFRRAFELTAERFRAREHPKTWFVEARSFPRKADPEAQGQALSGLHAPFICYFLDESGEIPPALLRKAEQGLSNCEWGKIVQAGNPTSHTGALYFAAQHAGDGRNGTWLIIRVTGDPDDPECSPRVDKAWCALQIQEYGRENPWVMSAILGKFPPSAINAMLSPDEVQDAMQRHLQEEDYSWSQKRLGVDVARFGDDRTVLFPRQGLRAFTPVVMRGERAGPIASRILLAKSKWHYETVSIDDTGTWGAGVIDFLHASGETAIPVNFSDPALDRRYRNRRSEMWIRMTEWVKRHGALPNIPEIVPELSGPTFSFPGGQFQLEPKEFVKKRIGRSPDLADSLALTFSEPEMAGGMSGYTAGRGSGRALTDWNPLAEIDGAARAVTEFDPHREM